METGDHSMKRIILAATAACAMIVGVTAAQAQSNWTPERHGYNSPTHGEFFSDAYRSGMKIGG
jgi:hypothetical protein